MRPFAYGILHAGSSLARNNLHRRLRAPAVFRLVGRDVARDLRYEVGNFRFLSGTDPGAALIRFDHQHDIGAFRRTCLDNPSATRRTGSLAA